MKKLLTIHAQLSQDLEKIALPPSSLFRRALVQRYSTQDEDAPQEILEKARSTAEEFIRQAKEKAESLKETASEVMEDSKKPFVGENNEADKEKNLEEKLKKGNFDH